MTFFNNPWENAWGQAVSQPPLSPQYPDTSSTHAPAPQPLPVPLRWPHFTPGYADSTTMGARYRAAAEGQAVLQALPIDLLI